MEEQRTVGVLDDGVARFDASQGQHAVNDTDPGQGGAPLSEFFRCPESLLRANAFPAEPSGWADDPDALEYSRNGVPGLAAQLEDLRRERYAVGAYDYEVLSSSWVRQLYYSARPIIPNLFRRALQRRALRDWNELSFPKWPVDTSVEELLNADLARALDEAGLERIPFIWFWPEGASCASLLTHDVETDGGLNYINQLIDIDAGFGFTSSIQLVPRGRYNVSQSLIDGIRDKQCEVNLHGLDHKGDLFDDHDKFLARSSEINRYIEEFGVEGFRSPSMYRNAEWLSALDIAFDMSVPNVAHLEPQRGGCCTVFPYFIDEILEIPLTTAQDHGLFHILQDYSIDLWKTQIAAIVQKHGLASFLIHPDYVRKGRSMAAYRSLLEYLEEWVHEENVWVARAGEINRWWRQRSQMRLEAVNGKWVIQGGGSERARIAYAQLDQGEIRFTVSDGSVTERT